MTLRPITLKVLERAVEEGVALARRRADKHADDPITDAQWDRLKDACLDCVLNSISEWFTASPQEAGLFEVKTEDQGG